MAEEKKEQPIQAEPLPDVAEKGIVAGDAPVLPNCDQGRYRLPPPKPAPGELLWRHRFGQ